MTYQSIQKAKTATDLDACIARLNQDGVFLVPNFLSPPELNSVKSFCEAELSKLPRDKYAFGKTKKYKKAELESYPVLRRLFTTPFMESLCLAYLGAGSEANSTIVLTQEFKFTGDLARNGDLHFDRLHSLKFFFYLTDVDRDNGAFHVVPGSHRKTRALREVEWDRTTEYDELKNRPALDYPELALGPDDAVPMEASAGSLIVFDTDCLHFGGIVKNGRSRIVLRGHCRDKQTLQKMKKPSLLKRVFEKAKSFSAQA